MLAFSYTPTTALVANDQIVMDLPAGWSSSPAPTCFITSPAGVAVASAAAPAALSVALTLGSALAAVPVRGYCSSGITTASGKQPATGAALQFRTVKGGVDYDKTSGASMSAYTGTLRLVFTTLPAGLAETIPFGTQPVVQVKCR
jgi:hypothetical protein